MATITELTAPEVARILDGYLETADFCDDHAHEDDPRPEVIGFHQSTIDAADRDCADFAQANRDDIRAMVAAGKSLVAIGGDFYLTRQRHGCGYWDGNYPEPFATRLTDAAHAYGTVDLYVGDDGWIYAMGDEPTDD